MNACPVNCSPQEFISHAKNGDFEQAVATITRNNPMGQTCGLICPDKFCMKACTRSRIDFAVNIPKVQATILENYRNPSAEVKAIRPNGRKVAVIGAGPAGLAAAAELGKQGYYVCLYEASDKIGGALNMIPDERLPYEAIAKDWSFIFNRDFITLYLTTKIGCPSDLFSQGFDGVIVATGVRPAERRRKFGDNVNFADFELNRFLVFKTQFGVAGRLVAFIAAENRGAAAGQTD